MKKLYMLSIFLIFFNCKDSKENEAVKDNEENVFSKEEDAVKDNKKNVSLKEEDGIKHSKKIILFENEILKGFKEGGYEKVEIREDGSIRFGYGSTIMKDFDLLKLTRYGKIYLYIKYRSSGARWDSGGTIFAYKDTEVTFADVLTGKIDYPHVSATVEEPDKTKLNYTYFYSLKEDKNEYSPPIEILRFMTPFGVGYYSDKFNEDAKKEKEKILKEKEALLNLKRSELEYRKKLLALSLAENKKEVKEEAEEQKALNEAQNAYDDLAQEIEYIKSLEGIDVRKPVQVYHWQDYVEYKMDVSHLEDLLSGKLKIGVGIGGGDGGQELMELSLIYEVPEIGQSNPERYDYINIANNTRYISQIQKPFHFDSDEYTYEFELDKDYLNAKLYYTSTGHGGYNEGDEFNKKTNIVVLDDKEVLRYIPWREDGFKFRDFNPATGTWTEKQIATFYGDEDRERKELHQLIASSDFNRSGWIPGDKVDPVIVELGDLKAGKHKIMIDVLGAQNDVVKNEDGSTSCCNSWTVSAYITARSNIYN